MKEKETKKLKKEKLKTGLDLMLSIKEMILNEYPQMKEDDVNSLANLLAKLHLGGKI